MYRPILQVLAATVCALVVLLYWERHSVGFEALVTEIARRRLLEEAAKLDPATVKEKHCQVTKGDWCGGYYLQKPVPTKPPVRGDKSCPAACSGIGRCDYDTGRCDCPPGFDGEDCASPRKRKCMNMGDDKRDKDLRFQNWGHTRCAGICDDNIAMCWCPPGTKYGHIPAPPGAPVGAPPIRLGRPLFMCDPSNDSTGFKLNWGYVPWEDLFSKSHGWCEVDVSKFRCPCRLDGFTGEFCNIPVEHYCLNQCNGHGDCNLGYCKCHDGWYGHDCSRRRAGVPLTPGDEEVKKPWLQAPLMTVPSAADPPLKPTRKRPFIYVYDLRPEFFEDLMAYRIERFHCTYRTFNHGNRTDFVGYNAYAVETMLHELMLTTEHRTFDPEEADFFYVPVHAGCIFDVYGWNDHPQYPPGVHGPRPLGASNMQREAVKWLKKHYPYFDRRGGRDHVWLIAHDEGACWAPIDIWPGVMLTHWGKMDWPHESHSSYWPDNYTNDVFHKDMPYGWLNYTSKAHPCYDPQKDLVIPIFKQPPHYAESHFMGADEARKRDILLFFRGDMGVLRAPHDPRCLYSRCIRQRLMKLSKEHNWRDKHKVLLGESKDLPGLYSDYLKKAIFCAVIPGDGWSARYEDSILHGCIPVIIMDNTHGPYEALLDYDKFSIRWPENKLEGLVEHLLNVSDDKIKSLQENVAKIWHRFRYNTHKLCLESSREIWERHKMSHNGLINVTKPREWATSTEDDAFSMIIQFLYSRINATR